MTAAKKNLCWFAYLVACLTWAVLAYSELWAFDEAGRLFAYAGAQGVQIIEFVFQSFPGAGKPALPGSPD